MTACECGAKWTGFRVAHCSVCHQTFTTVANFDRHRRDGSCVNPNTLDMTQNTHGAWYRPDTTGWRASDAES